MATTSRQPALEDSYLGPESLPDGRSTTLPDSFRWRALRESLLIGTVGLLTMGIGLFGLWISATGSIRENYRHGLVELAQAAASQVDPVLHAQLRNPADRN